MAAIVKNLQESFDLMRGWLGIFLKSRLGALLIVAVVVTFLGYARFAKGIIEQDNYLEYAGAFSKGRIEDIGLADTRLMPGLPILIAVGRYIFGDVLLAGYMILLISFVLSGGLMNRLTKSNYGWLALVFPPIVLDQMSLISTESVLVLALLIVYGLVKRKNYVGAALVASLSVWLRLIGVGVWLAVVVLMVTEKKWKQLALGLTSLLASWLSLVGFNKWMFGDASLFLYQIEMYRKIGRSSLALHQLYEDIFRAIDWGWYAQVWSGVSYLLLLMVAAGMVWKYKNKLWVGAGNKFLMLSVGFMMVFVFSIGPTPFLEEFPRFLVPVFVYLWLLVWDKLKIGKMARWLLVVLSLVVVIN